MVGVGEGGGVVAAAGEGSSKSCAFNYAIICGSEVFLWLFTRNVFCKCLRLFAFDIFLCF